MKALFYNPATHVSSPLELPDQKEAYVPRINEILGCEQYLSLGTREDSVHVCADLKKMDPKKQAKVVDGITAPLYEPVLLVGFDPAAKAFISLPAGFIPEELELSDISMEQARERMHHCCLEGLFKYEGA